eukprot:SAG11_NODE_246_length_11683_cov_15.540142_5_plen_64_part_00
MEGEILREAPVCILFVLALSLMLLSMVYAFDTEKMASVHRLISESVSHGAPQFAPQLDCRVVA